MLTLAQFVVVAFCATRVSSAMLRDSSGTDVLQIRTVSNHSASTFMVVAGMTGADELCLTAEDGQVATLGARIALESCRSSIAAGDGRELFSFLPSGQLYNVTGLFSSTIC
jgi:hypothetical protein